MDSLFIIRILVCLSILACHIGKCQQTQSQSEVRITKLCNCNNETKLKWIFKNGSISYSYPRSYLNGDLNVTEDTKSIKKIIVHLDRCIDEGFTCEDFQTWHIDDFCPMLNWKNQLWSGFCDAIHPSFRCPIKKGIYQVRRATYDVSAVTRWYPEYAQYYWITKVKVLNEQDELVFCADYESYIYQYTKRNRKS